MQKVSIDKIIKQQIREKKLLGASIAVWHDSELIHKAEYGIDREDSIYKIFSMSKPITSTAVMILKDKYNLDFNTPVREYFPTFKELYVMQPNREIVPAQNELRIQNLLNMTSGLGYPDKNDPVGEIWSEFESRWEQRREQGEIITTKEICSEMSEIPLAFEPGTSWKYGASADLLGGIVEVVSGKSFGDFLKEEIFEPLEMNDTAFYVPENNAERIAPMSFREETTGKVIVAGEKEIQTVDTYHFTLPSPFVNRTRKPVFESGGAGLYSTLDNYGKFLNMLYNKGVYKGRRIIQEKTYEFMVHNQLSKAMRDKLKEDMVAGFCLFGYGYSNLLRIMTDPDEAQKKGNIGVQGEFGWDGLPGNYCMVDPEKKIVLLYLEQIAQGPDREFRENLRKAVYESVRGV